MRIFLSVTIVAFLLPAAAVGQVPSDPGVQTGASAAPAAVPDIRTSNFVDFGFRGTAFGENSDEARYQRYRDFRNGAVLDVFRFSTDNASRSLGLEADHVGYRDQRYGVSFDQFGRLKASFEWNQIPLFFSSDTMTPFTTVSPGVLRLDDSVQRAPLATAAAQAEPFDLRLKRNVADFAIRYSATQNVDLSVNVRNTTKNGTQPWDGTFGFSNAVEVPGPVDTRTTELGAALEWTAPRGSARLGYDGSFFRNSVETLVWDNPLRATDSPSAGPAQGRMALWPDSVVNAGSAMGVLNLPRRSRATAYVSIGNWSQNQPLIPFTINSALPELALDRTTADAQARVTTMNYSFNSRPVNNVFVTARYRSYDFDNRTPEFHVTKTVAYDTSVAAFAEGGTSPYSFTRRTFDGEVSLTPFRHGAFRAGYTREQVKQTFRLFDTTNEDTLRLSADATGLTWATLRGTYEHAKRTGTGLDEQVLDEINEQTSLRQFDISDRTSDRFSLIAQIMPASPLSFNATVSIGSEDRPGAVFGLRSNDNHAYGIGVDFVPREAVSLGVSYEAEKYTALQASRQANPPEFFTDPTKDWTTDSADTTHTVTAALDLVKAWPRTDIRLAYDFSRAESLYVYGLVPGSTLPPVAQLPAVVNRLQRATVDVRYYLTAHLAAGFRYWYDAYRVDDFAQGQQTLTGLAQPSFLIMGYVYRPYTANAVVARLTYLW